MLSERTRNVFLGLTVLAAIALLVVGISLSSRLLTYTRPGYNVTLEAANAAGVMPGAKVDFNGVVIGTVTSVRVVTVAHPLVSGRSSWLAPATAPATLPGPAVVAEVMLRIENDKNIPVNAAASIGQKYIGTSFVSFSVGQAEAAFLPKDGSARIAAGQADSGLFPKEIFADVHVLKEDLSVLSRELTTVARDLHKMLVYTPLERLEQFPVGDPRRPPDNISTLVLKLNRTVDAINVMLADGQIQKDIREVLKNFAEASKQVKEVLAAVHTAVSNADKSLQRIGPAADQIGTAATQASATVETARAQLLKISERFVETLAAVEKATQALVSEKGTTGKLVNDPRLYDGLVDLTQSLKSTTEDLSKLVRQWKTEGVPLKLK